MFGKIFVIFFFLAFLLCSQNSCPKARGKGKEDRTICIFHLYQKKQKFSQSPKHSVSDKYILSKRVNFSEPHLSYGMLIPV